MGSFISGFFMTSIVTYSMMIIIFNYETEKVDI